MERNTKWRSIGLLALMVVCIATLLPSMVPARSLPSWFTDWFDSKIALGTDIDGGARFVYSIDLDKAVDDKASEIKRSIEAKLADDKIKGTVKTPSVALGAVTVSIDDAARRPAIEALIKSDYAGVVIPRTCSPTDMPGSICVRVSSDFADGIKRAALRNAVNTIRERIDEKGVAEPTVIEKGDDIIVELPGLDDQQIQNIKDIIARTAKLEMKVVDNNAKFMSDLFAHVDADAAAAMQGIKAETDSWGGDDGKARQIDYYLYAEDRDEAVTVAEAKKLGCWNKDLAESGGKVRCNVSGRYAIERYLAELASAQPQFKLPDDRQMGFEFESMQKDRKPFWRTYYLDRAIRLTGSAIENAVASFDQQTNQPVVIVKFNRYGGRIFGELTAQNVGKKIATILDDKVKSAPIINVAIRGGSAEISMGGGDPQVQQQEADNLVAVLKTGSLPAPLREESTSKVGPTLGMDAVDKAKFAFVMGIVLVVVIMIGIYKWSGVIAVGAVVVNVLLMLFVMATFGATLTLPGIAAVVLTVGMAVDGNILIYERIRDELLTGKSVRGAVDLGFSRAFSAILDGQLTTAAAGWVLLQYGSGPIKGFAVMLLVGIATTLFSNIWVSRLFFDWYIAKKKGQLATISI